MTLSIQDFLGLLERRLALLSEGATFFSLSDTPFSATVFPRIPLILGNGQSSVRRIGWALEAGERECLAAAERHLDLLLLWNPLWSAPPDTLRSDSPGPGRAVERLTRAHCAAALIGPALTNSPAGPDLLLASELGLTALRPLFKRLPVPSDRLKLVIFTPVGYENVIIQALAQEGAGVIGRYSHCTFRTPGTGTYRPLEGAQPWAGTVGRLESAEEMRLETVVPREKAAQVLDRVRAVHPYEEMACDFYPLEDLREVSPSFGWVGEVSLDMGIRTFQMAVERCFGDVRVTETGEISGENPGQAPLFPRSSSRLALCLSGSSLGEAEAASLVRAGCGWVVCGGLTPESRLVLSSSGVRVVQLEEKPLQNVVFDRLCGDSVWRKTCADEGIDIERI
jgi:hypothetical protein